MVTTRVDSYDGDNSERTVTVVLNERDAYNGVDIRIVVRKGDNGVIWLDEGYEDEILFINLVHDGGGALTYSMMESANPTNTEGNTYPDYFTFSFDFPSPPNVTM